MIPYAPITFDTIARAYSLLADCEDEFPITRGVDGFPAFAVKRYGVYREIDAAARDWLEGLRPTTDDAASCDETDDDDDDVADVLEDPGFDYDDFDVWYDEPCASAPAEEGEGEVSSFRSVELEAPRATGSRRRIVEVAACVPPVTSAQLAADEARADAPAPEDRLPTRIGLRRARHAAR